MTEEPDDRNTFRLVEIELPAEAFGPTGKTHDGYGVKNRVDSQ